jgi:hypothetical protein
VHAWATLYLYKMGGPWCADLRFLERRFRG